MRHYTRENLIYEMNKIKFKKDRIEGAIYYDVFYKSGSIRLWISDKNPRELFLSNLIVQPTERGKGIGQLLLDYSEVAAKKLGLKRIALKVLKDSWMEVWYKRNGYLEDYIWDEEERVVKYLHKDLK